MKQKGYKMARNETFSFAVSYTSIPPYAFIICARSTLYLHHYTISSNPLSSLRAKYPTQKLANLAIYDFPLDLELHITSNKLITSANTPVSLWHIHCNVFSFICLSEKNKKNYNSVISQPCQLGRTLLLCCSSKAVFPLLAYFKNASTTVHCARCQVNYSHAVSTTRVLGHSWYRLPKYKHKWVLATQLASTCVTFTDTRWEPDNSQYLYKFTAATPSEASTHDRSLPVEPVVEAVWKLLGLLHNAKSLVHLSNTPVVGTRL